MIVAAVYDRAYSVDCGKNARSYRAYSLAVEEFDGEKNRSPNDFEAGARYLVHRIGVGVVELSHAVELDSHSSKLSVDNVDGRDADVKKLDVVVSDTGFILKEVLGVA